MDRIIRHITEQLVNLLPDDTPYYRLDELRSWGFPLFIIQRIRVELERNLAESMNLPRTDWANMQSPAIQTVWEQFIEAIRQEARLPASYVNPVIETAVADIVDMLVQPRKNLPEVIFGADQELTYDQIASRMDAIVVYRHFAALIPRYMQKKGLQKLTKKRCTEIIANVDDRLTKRYSPLNWAQMLDPLFSLLNQQIDTNLLRLFFEDKKMPRLARQFDRLNSSVDRARLIEVLSSPESLNMEGYEEEQSELFEGNEQQDGEVEPEKQKKTSGKNGEHEGVETEREKDSSALKQSRRISGKDPIVDAFHTFRENLQENEAELKEKEDTNIVINEEAPEVPDTGKRNYLNDIFRKPDEDNEAGIRVSDDNKTEPAGTLQKPEEVTDKENNVTSSVTSREEPSDDEVVDAKGAGEVFGQADLRKGETEQDDEVPMWKRFLSPEELAELETRETGERLADESTTGLAKESESSDTQVKLLKELLKDDRSFFVDKIFKGSDEAYDETVTEIVHKEDWQSASKYIAEEVFERNLVDMYSEAAVDFTDRLHTYFLKNRNHKQQET